MLKMEFGNKLNSEMALSLKQTLPLLIKKIRLLISCCTLCGNACQQHQLLCQYCQADLPYFKEHLIGFDLLSWPAIKQALPKTTFDHLFSLAPYQWPFSTWINQLKYQGKTELAGLLAYLLAQRWQQYLSTIAEPKVVEQVLVLSVPLHISKWQERGFNQAHLIAKRFAKQLNYNYQPELLIREKVTQSQVGKSGVERRKNLANAFHINSAYTGGIAEHVILIDDVVTTGTTANEICKLLKKRGVQTITLLSICLALPS
jgi:ComF family protein